MDWCRGHVWWWDAVARTNGQEAGRTKNTRVYKRCSEAQRALGCLLAFKMARRLYSKNAAAYRYIDETGCMAGDALLHLPRGHALYFKAVIMRLGLRWWNVLWRMCL